jgi:hypothetical protein
MSGIKKQFEKKRFFTNSKICGRGIQDPSTGEQLQLFCVSCKIKKKGGGI